MANLISLENIFLGLQEQMITKLKTNKDSIIHPGTKGDTSELCWLDLFKKYLPMRYQTEKAFVLDSKGQLSDQIDIVVFDRQYSPFLFNQDGALYVPAESVYAVFEVKPELNKENFEYAALKAESVSRLYRTNANIYHADGVIEKPKIPFRIITGLLTLNCGWKSLNESVLIKTISSIDKVQPIDIGCALEGGAFNITYEDGLNIKISKTEHSLISFFLDFLSVLQRLGTVPAIDIEQYAKSLNN